MRVALYSRVSTAGQARAGVSLETQEQLARERCAALGWSLTAVYTDVESGRKDDRTNLGRLLEDAKAGRLDAVFVYRLDRLGRSLVRTLQVVGELADAGVRLVSLTQPFEIDGSLGKLMLSIYASFAEMESEAIGARIRDARRQRLQTERKHYSTAPFGYKKVDGDLIVVPETAEVVRWIFEQAAAGRSIRSIAIELHDKGLPTPAGAPWQIQAVKHILTNHTYMGKLSHGRRIVRRTSKGQAKRTNSEPGTFLLVDGVHEPLVTPELWEAANVGVEARRGKSPKRSGAEDSHPWLGVTYCGLCGSRVAAMTMAHSGKIQLYCDRRRKMGVAVCGASSISVRILNGALVRAMAPLLAAGMKRPARRKQQVPKPTDHAKEIARLESSIQRESDLYRIGAQPLATTEARVKDLRAQIDRLASATPATPVAPPQIDDFEGLWRGLPRADQASLVRSLVDRVTLGEDTITLEWLPKFRGHLGDSLTVARPTVKGTAARLYGFD